MRGCLSNLSINQDYSRMITHEQIMEFVPRKPKATNLLLTADFVQLFEYTM